MSPSILKSTVSLCFIANTCALGIPHVNGFGSGGTPPTMNRATFFKDAIDRVRLTVTTTTTITTMATCTATVTSLLPTSANAIEFVPASPYFTGTYGDAIDILHAQRIACDNIEDVITRGDLNEAGFKLMQVLSQTRMGGKIVLDEWQIQGIPLQTVDVNTNRHDNAVGTFMSNTSTNKSVDTLRLLKAQKKFGALMDTCDECTVQVENALRGKLGTSAVAQIKLLTVLNDARSAFDDFLLEVEYE